MGTLKERPAHYRGANVRIALADFEPKNPDDATPPLTHAAPVIIPLSTIHCEGCGAELQIPTKPHVYACPNPACRSMYWYPCEICHEDKRKCKGKKCVHDNGRYIEAVLITRGGTK